MVLITWAVKRKKSNQVSDNNTICTRLTMMIAATTGSGRQWTTSCSRMRWFTAECDRNKSDPEVKQKKTKKQRQGGHQESSSLPRRTTLKLKYTVDDSIAVLGAGIRLFARPFEEHLHANLTRGADHFWASIGENVSQVCRSPPLVFRSSKRSRIYIYLYLYIHVHIFSNSAVIALLRVDPVWFFRGLTKST